MKRHEAHYWREGDVWEVELTDDERVHTFASTLGRARRYIREATAAMYDVDIDAVEIDDDIDLPDGLATRADNILTRRKELDQATTEMTEQTIRLLELLLDTGLSVRDAGELVHLSPQRVSQLTRR